MKRLIPFLTLFLCVAVGCEIEGLIKIISNVPQIQS